jgi:hypothetical protein
MQISLGYNGLRVKIKRKRNPLDLLLLHASRAALCMYVCVCVCVRMPFTGEWSSSVDDEKRWWEDPIYLADLFSVSTAYPVCLEPTADCHYYPTAKRLEQHGQSSVELDEIASHLLLAYVCVCV